MDKKLILINAYVEDIGLTECGFSYQVYKAIYKKYYRCTHRYGMWMLNDAFTIDNVVQEAFLKLWNYRESITSLEHASRFLKLQVKWECHAYFRSPVSRFHRRFTYLDATGNDDSLLYLGEEQDEEEQDAITRGQLKAINDMMPFVAEGREKNLMKLYYVDGLSYKQIAARYGISITAVGNALQKGIAKLKAMIVQPQKLFSTPVVLSRASDAGQRVWLYDIEGLSKEQSQIYRMRTELRHEFASIARSLGLPQAYVQREYVKAWKVVSQQKKEKTSVWQAGSGAHQRTDYKPVTIRIA
jgi:RNA polymerase sigma factor (sigma-70 family)